MEVQEQLRPLHEAILNPRTSGSAYFAEDLLIKVQRRGKPEGREDARFTMSYSPIPDDAAPTGVGGVLRHRVVETASTGSAPRKRSAPARSVSGAYF